MSVQGIHVHIQQESAHGGDEALLDTDPVSDQDGHTHCQQVIWCTHSGGIQTISRMPVPVHTLGSELG